MKLKRKELEIVMQALNTLIEDSCALCDECPTTIEYSEVLGKLEAEHEAYLRLLSKCEKAYEENIGV
jgi:hypothetical protein